MAGPVLVTGAGGFIGSHLTEALVRRGDRVASPRALQRARRRGASRGPAARDLRRRRRGIRYITDPYAIREVMRGQSVVFHLTALIAIPYSYVAPHSFFATNALGAVHLLEAARQEEVARVVHISSSECYGSAQTQRIAETHSLVAQSPYAASKIAADQAAESYRRAFGVPVVTVRSFNAFGPRQSARAIVTTIVTQALSTGTVKLGDPQPRRDLTLVTDSAAAMIADADAATVVGETINIGNGQDISIGELADRILALLAADGVSAQLEYDSARLRPAASEVARLCAETGRARRLLGWTPAVSLSEGLAATIRAIRGDLDSYPRAEVYQR